MNLLHDLIAASAAARPDHIALYAASQRASYRQLAELVQSVANGLKAAGVARRAVHITTAEGESLAVLPGCEGMATVVSWSSDGSRIAAGLADGQVCLWDVTNL